MSGFSYPEWIGDVYPAGTKRTAMLGEYAKIFNAVEINMTFRRRPQEPTLERWRDAVPDHFRFAMKANQQITHWRRLANVGDIVREFVDRARSLGDKLGPILFQVPANLKFDADLVASFGESLPPGRTYAFEPRDASYMTDEAKKALRARGIALCLNDDLFDPSEYATTGTLAYLRFHRDAYDADDLDERASLVIMLASEGIDVYAFFAHEDNPDSVRPALRFRELVAA
jgi:uncharacterized protein YecE (DUF72 family)